MPKTEKESRRNRDAELQELRKENEDLRRTVARLRKTLEKRGGLVEEEDEGPEKVFAPGAPLPLSTPATKCHCGSIDHLLFSTPTGKILICRACKARRRVVQ